jgi:predicted NACHT family NTPase
LEYFCAWEFVWQFEKEKTLTSEQLINNVFGAHWQDESWHEVLRLICGMIEPKFVEKIIDFLLEQEIDRSKFLTPSYFSKRYYKMEKKEESKGKLFQEEMLLREKGLSNLILAVNCFAEVRNKNLIFSISEKLLSVLKQEIEQQSPYRFSKEILQNLTFLIATIWQDNPNTLPWLKKIIHLSLNTPEASIESIATVWKNHPDIFVWLQECAIQQQNWEDKDIRERNRIARIAVGSIARHYSDNPDTLPWLKELALNNKNEVLRESALLALAKLQKYNKDVLNLIRNHAVNDESVSVRGTLLRLLIEKYEETPEILSYLEDRALRDEDETVKTMAVWHITQWKKGDSKLFELLCNIACNTFFTWEYDSQLDLRQAALERLLENFGDNPKTLQILNQVALNDSDEKLQKFAVQKLQDLKNANL